MKHWKKPFTILVLALAACLLLGVGAFAAEAEPAVIAFNDIAGTEYESDITVMYTMGLTVGYTDGSYRPGRAYCRLEVAQLTQGLLGLDAPEGYILPFADTQDAMGREAIAAAVAGGYMSGRSELSFDPYGSVLKAEFMSVLARIAQTLGTEDLLSKLDEELTLWAEDFSVITAGQAMHAARAMIGALEAQPTEEEPAASEEPSGEMPAEELPEEVIAEEIPAEEVIAAEETEIAPEEAVEEEIEAPAEETVEGEASEEPAASGEPSEEPSAEMNTEEEPAEEAEPQPEAPAAPQGVLSPTATTPTPAPVEVPAAPAPVEAPAQPATPAQPQATQTPEINPDDPGAEMKTTVYAFYADIRDQLVSFFNDLLG